MNAPWSSNTSRSSSLAERARRVFANGNTRELVWMEPHPPYAASGNGACIIDVDGARFLDLANNLGVLIHGHAHPRVTEVVAQQLSSGVCFALPTESEIELAELLCERIESFEQIRFANTGSEAVNLALKAARAHTGRSVIAKLEGVYHGSSDFSEISVGPSPENWGNEPRPMAAHPGTPPGLLDSVLVLTANEIESTREALLARGGELAAVIVDPVPPRCGMLPLDREYIELLRSLTREIGALLIFDEVISFRLGFEGAQGRFGGDPDLTALGKIIGGGHPVGAVAGRAEYMRTIGETIKSSGTFTANPITMKAGLETMRLLDRAAFESLDAIGDRLRLGMRAAIDRAQIQAQVSGVGSLIGIHPHTRTLGTYRDYYRGDAEQQWLLKLYRALLERGVLIAPSGTCFLSTAITPDDEARFLSAFSDSIEKLGAVV